VLLRVLLGLAAALAVAGAAIADDADLCADDGADAPARIDACTRLTRSGKYRGNNLAAVYNNRGIAYRRQNEFARAQADYTEAIRLNPRSSYFYASRARAYDKLGDDAKAESDRARAKELEGK